MENYEKYHPLIYYQHNTTSEAGEVLILQATPLGTQYSLIRQCNKRIYLVYKVMPKS